MPFTFRSSRWSAYLLALAVPLMMLVGAADAGADISFRADYENAGCCVSGGWHDVQYENERPMSESFSIVSNPVRQGRYAAKVVVQQAYSPFGYNESTEAATGITGQGEGADYYYAWSTMFDPKWVSPYGWGDIVQFYTHNWEKFGGPPPIALDTSGSHIDLAVLTGRFDEPGTSADAWRGWYTHPGTSTSSLIGYSFKQNFRILDTLSLGRWNDFVMHVHWSAHNGKIQMWHRLAGASWLPVLDVNVPTLRYDPGTNVSDDIGLLKQGLYRQSYCHQPTILTACNSVLGVQPPDILYQDAFVRGSSFAEVVAAAFDGSASSVSAAPTPPQPAPPSSPQPAPAGPDQSLIASFASVTDPGCGACAVSTSRGSGDVDATIGGGLDSADTAYGLADFGGSSGWSGRVWTRDVIALASSTALRGNIAVLQQRDVSDKLVWEIYVDGSNRQISLWSPAGGLGSSALNRSTGIAMDGQSHRVGVSALPNDSVVVRVDGQDRITLTGLSGSTSGKLRLLRVGIDHYDTSTSSERITISHTDVGVSTLGWLGSRVSPLAVTPAAASPAPSPSPSASSAPAAAGGAGAGGSAQPVLDSPPPAGGSPSSSSPPAKAPGKLERARVSARRPVIFVERPRITARGSVRVRLAARPRAVLQIIVRDIRGRALGSAYATIRHGGRSLQLISLHRWSGQKELRVVIRSERAGAQRRGPVRRTSMRIHLTGRELAFARRA
jgi:hypothetical protein